MFRILLKARVTSAILVLITFVLLVEWLKGAFSDPRILADMGAITPDMITRREYWRAVTAMFLHGGPLHWLVNAWALFQLGSLYEVMFGSARFALIYFASGVVASLSSAIITRALAVGASGAIFGIFGAFFFSIMRSPVWRHDKMARSLLPQLVFWAGLNIALGFQGGRHIGGVELPLIDNAAHLGGLAAGILLGLIPHRVPPPPPASIIVDVSPRHYGGE